MFEVPVPGQSLTSSPGKYPYERPPEITDPKIALQKHLEGLSKEGMAENIVNILERDIDVKTLTEGILRSAVSKGVHSIDVSLTIAPVIHRFIKKTADDAGIEYDEGLVDKEAQREKEEILAKDKAYSIAENWSEEDTAELIAKEEVPKKSSGFMQRKK